MRHTIVADGNHRLQNLHIVGRVGDLGTDGGVGDAAATRQIVGGVAQRGRNGEGGPRRRLLGDRHQVGDVHRDRHIHVRHQFIRRQQALERIDRPLPVGSRRLRDDLRPAEESLPAVGAGFAIPKLLHPDGGDVVRAAGHIVGTRGNMRFHGIAGGEGVGEREIDHRRRLIRRPRQSQRQPRQRRHCDRPDPCKLPCSSPHLPPQFNSRLTSSRRSSAPTVTSVVA